MEHASAPLRLVPAAAAADAAATCPLCHTLESGLSSAALAAGASWKCAVCGQFWDAERLHTAASYRAWVVALGPVQPQPWSASIRRSVAQ